MRAPDLDDVRKGAGLLLKRDGQITGGAKPEDLIDTSFARKAVAALGPYRKQAR